MVDGQGVWLVLLTLGKVYDGHYVLNWVVYGPVVVVVVVVAMVVGLGWSPLM